MISVAALLSLGNMVLVGAPLVALAIALWRLPRSGVTRLSLSAWSFLGSVVAFVLILCVEVPGRKFIDPRQNVSSIIVYAMFLAATEEVIRAILFVVVRRRASRVLDPREWITLGLVLGLTFSLLENALACSTSVTGKTAFLRACLSAAGHPAYASVFALGAVAQHFYGKRGATFAGLIAATLLHAGFDGLGLALKAFPSDLPEAPLRVLQALIAYGSLSFVWVKTQRFSANARSSQGLGEAVVVEA